MSTTSALLSRNGQVTASHCTDAVCGPSIRRPACRAGSEMSVAT